MVLYSEDEGYKLTSDNTHGRLVCDFVLGGNCSRGVDANSKRTSNYSPTGFLNKKFVNPDLVKSKNGYDYTNTPWPLIRLAELYLGYAECLAESGDLTNARLYLDKVRTRAGLPGEGSLRAVWYTHPRLPPRKACATSSATSA